MRTHLIILLLPAMSLATQAAGAQAVPDTTAPWRYYPLGIGDEWHYRVEVIYYVACFPCRYDRTEEVVGAEVIDGHTYALIRNRTFNVPLMTWPPPPPPEWFERVRFDTLSALPMALGTNGEYPRDADGCRLDEPFPIRPDTTLSITCPDPWAGTVQGGYDQPLPFGGTAAVKSIERTPNSGISTFNTTFAAGIGVLQRVDEVEQDSGDRDSLVYAHIAGVEYGAPIVATEPTPHAGELVLRVAPNPTDGRAEAIFHTPAAGPARLAIHDLLGRELLIAHDSWAQTGTNRVAIDVANLPTGVYLVRATARDGTIATTLAVR